MSWIQSHTGRKIDPLAMTAGDVAIDDIAHALALKCRYTGHCPWHYSVAQHSVLVAQHCIPSAATTDKLWALLHDAAEAYLADIARPVKIGLRAQFGDAFDQIERRIMDAVCDRFGLPREEPECVKVADELLLTTEAKRFFGDSNLYDEWQHRPANGFAIIDPACVFEIPWREAEREFFVAFRRLQEGRRERVVQS